MVQASLIGSADASKLTAFVQSGSNSEDIVSCVLLRDVEPMLIK